MFELPINIKNDLLYTGFNPIKLYKHNRGYILVLEHINDINFDYKDFSRFNWVTGLNPLYNNDYKIVKLCINL